MMTIEEYIENHGQLCPRCKSDHINVGFLETFGYTSAILPASCVNCGCRWTEYYDLAEIEIDDDG